MVACGGGGAAPQTDAHASITQLKLNTFDTDFAFVFDPVGQITEGSIVISVSDQNSAGVTKLERSHLSFEEDGIASSPAAFSMVENSPTLYTITYLTSARTGSHKLKLTLTVNGVSTNHESLFQVLPPAEPKNAVTYSLPGVPLDLVTGKLNNDSNQDVAVIVGTQLLVFPGTPDGDFGMLSAFSAGGAPKQLAVADVSGDGFSDIVALQNKPLANVVILKNNGAGRFSSDDIYSVGTNPVGIISGHLNGDNIVDLCVGDGSSQQVSVLLGLGGGRFNPAVTYTVGGTPVHLVSADFNNDGFQDLATANSSGNNLSVLLGKGDGSFGPASHVAVQSGPTSVVAADFNGDRRLDLASCNPAAKSISVLLGHGNGTFAAAKHLSTGSTPGNLDVRDANRDGHLDLGTVIADSATVIVYQGKGDGTFPYVAFALKVSPGPKKLIFDHLRNLLKTDYLSMNTTEPSFSVILAR